MEQENKGLVIPRDESNKEKNKNNPHESDPSPRINSNNQEKLAIE